MKKAILIALIIIIIGLLVIIFCQPSGAENASRNDTSAVTESTADIRNSEGAQSDITEPASELTLETESEVTTAPMSEPSKEEDIEFDYVLNTNTKKFHYPSCKSVEDIKDSNRNEYHGTRDGIIDRGYSPCGKCKP